MAVSRKTKRKDQKISIDDTIDDFPFSSPEDRELQKRLEDFFYEIKKTHLEYLEENVGDVKIYLVGGAVREIVRGNQANVKDWDFAVEAHSFSVMREWLNREGFHIYLEKPEYFTLRAKAPDKDFVFAGIDMTNRTFDFTLCRTEGDYTDGRRPDSVEIGNIKTDLSRRDFTMNAIAMDASGTLIDPFDGQKDINLETIRCVGSTERLREDSLRMLRALRFAVQLDFSLSGEIIDFLYNFENADLLDNVSEDRIRDELTKMFKIDTLESLYYLTTYAWIKKKVFDGDLWLMPTSKGK